MRKKAIIKRVSKYAPHYDPDELIEFPDVAL